MMPWSNREWFLVWAVSFLATGGMFWRLATDAPQTECSCAYGHEVTP